MYSTILLPELRLPAFWRVPQNVFHVISIVNVRRESASMNVICVVSIATREIERLSKLLVLFSLRNKKYSRSKNEVEPLMSHGLFYRCILCFWTWEHFSCVAVYGVSDNSQFHQKHLYLCSEDERRSYGFGTT